MGRSKGQEVVQLTSKHEILAFISDRPRTMKEVQIEFGYSYYYAPKKRLGDLMGLDAIRSISTLRELEEWFGTWRLGPNPTFLTKVYVITKEGEEILEDWHLHGCSKKHEDPAPLNNCSLCPSLRPVPKPRPIKKEKGGHGNFMPGQRGVAPPIGAS